MSNAQRFFVVDSEDVDPDNDNSDVTGWYGVADENEGGIVVYVGSEELAERIRQFLASSA